MEHPSREYRCGAMFLFSFLLPGRYIINTQPPVMAQVKEEDSYRQFNVFFSFPSPCQIYYKRTASSYGTGGYSCLGINAGDVAEGGESKILYQCKS